MLTGLNRENSCIIGGEPEKSCVKGVELEK